MNKKPLDQKIKEILVKLNECFDCNAKFRHVEEGYVENEFYGRFFSDYFDTTMVSWLREKFNARRMRVKNVACYLSKNDEEKNKMIVSVAFVSL